MRMQKWEYLRVCIENSYSMSNLECSHSKPKRVYVIGDDGLLIEREKATTDSDHSVVVSRLLKQLGEEGYELTCSGAGRENVEVVLYFKHPKQAG
jgi:hypothetical protein